MPEEKEPPRPHGDKLTDRSSVRSDDRSNEENRAQRQSDAAPDAVGDGSSGREESDRERGRGSTANGVPVFDEDDGAQRKRQYRDGADLVSGLD